MDRGDGVYKLAAFIWGTCLWAATTLLHQAIGEWWLRPEQSAWMLGWFAAAIPYAYGWTESMYSYLELNGRSRLEAAVRFVWINLLLHSVTLLRFEAWFPNLPPQAGFYMGAWLLWLLTLVLATAWLPQRLQSRGA